jgi:hypothetical protein
MSEAHVVTCDDCRVTQEVWCDGRGPAREPAGWLRQDNDDYCEECREGHEG